MNINPVKGTHDIINEEATMYVHIEYLCRFVSSLYGFKEIRTPIIEHTNLFQRSVGESSDIVNKEMYTFMDKGGRSLTLRPEMTAGVMRSIVSNKLYANADLPLKYCYAGPCFRYERPQAGRYRQFHQFGVEAVGVSSFYHDLEVLLLGKAIFDALFIKDITIKINTLGDEQTRTNYKKALKEYFAKYIDNMCEDCKRRYEINPLRILDCKVEEDKKIIANAPKIRDYLSDEARAYFDSIVKELDALKINYEIDDNLVRGLDYYTGLVFEYHSLSNSSLGAIGGGGHYNNLLKEVGGPDLEGVGLSLGLERLVECFKNLKFESHPVGPDFYVISSNEESKQFGFSVAETLRNNGYDVDMNYENKSFKSQFKLASKCAAKFAIILGEEELNKGEIKVKNLKTQEQTYIKIEDMPVVLNDMLNEYQNNEDIENAKRGGKNE